MSKSKEQKLPALSERDFSLQVEDLFKIFHWRYSHFRPAQTAKGWRTSITGYKGFPDYVAAKGKRIIFAELKSEIGKLTPDQEDWIALLKLCPGVEVYVWKPNDLQEIANILLAEVI